MAITVENVENKTTLGVSEFLDHVVGSVDACDYMSLHSASAALYSLQNNRDFLAEYFNAEIIRTDRKRLAQYLSPQSFVFGATPCGRFAVRCNVWIPLEGSPAKQAMESRIFAYGLPHSHNFSFLTVGYHGSGYRSEIHEIEDPDEVRGYIGEPISLRFLENTYLSRGKVMIYRRGVDVHTQLPPREISISLNLLVADKANNSTPQFYVDMKSKTIIGFPEINTASKRLTMLTLAKLIGNIDTIDVLEDVMKTTLCFRTKVGAASAIEALLPASQRDNFRGMLEFDPAQLDVSVGDGLGRNENYKRVIAH